MLSNPTNNLQNRQRQHRRQNSTPTAFEPVKVSCLPKIQRNNSHRRGMSLDQRQRQGPPQELMINTTNLGYQTTPQHILRETQQQRLGRPGQQFSLYNNDENYLQSPNVAAQSQAFNTGCTSQYGDSEAQSHFQSTGQVSMTMNLDPSSFSGSQDFNLYSSDTILTPSAFLDFGSGYENVPGTSSGDLSRRTSAGRRISGGIADRVSRFENMGLQTSHRPETPNNQNFDGSFPLTPMGTPHQRLIKHEPVNARFRDDFDTSMEITIKPRSRQRARGVFDDMRREVEKHSMPSPPPSGSTPIQCTFDSAPMPTGDFMNVSNSSFGALKTEPHLSKLHYAPSSTSVSPALSYPSSPEMNELVMFEDQYSNQASIEFSKDPYPPPDSMNFPTHGVPIPDSPSRASDHRRSESICSINIEETITDTGITMGDIARFVQGPDPTDGRWLCVYPDCNKRFGRKENIKSHVQTHLGDRQFQCPHCRKCFVRQHDLKRHAKIHSGVKPYPCQCGNSFARHDALTRHRQRGMCIGAFEGVVKKVVKRGRPRKPRPDNEERHTKSSKTRSKNKATSSASSTSGYSESGEDGSPCSEMDVLDERLDERLFSGFGYVQTSTMSDNHNFQYSQPQSPTPNEFVTPQALQAHSPSAFSSHSYMSHRGSVAEGTHLPSHPSSPAKSVHSALSYQSPPGLCDSSSSPVPSQYYDCEQSVEQIGEMNMNGLVNMSQHDEEMFLEAFAAASNGDSGMTALERQPDSLMVKFEDAFGSTGDNDLFRNEEDVFFGSP